MAPRSRRLLASLAGLAAAIAVLPHARLWLWNTESPVFRAVEGAQPRGETAAALVALALVVAVGIVAALGARRLLATRRGALALLVAGTLAASAAWVLWPVACDTHESFEDVPNRTCECRGWTVASYPPGVMDAAESEMCVGIERPVARVRSPSRAPRSAP